MIIVFWIISYIEQVVHTFGLYCMYNWQLCFPYFKNYLLKNEYECLVRACTCTLGQVCWMLRCVFSVCVCVMCVPVNGADCVEVLLHVFVKVAEGSVPPEVQKVHPAITACVWNLVKTPHSSTASLSPSVSLLCPSIHLSLHHSISRHRGPQCSAPHHRANRRGEHAVSFSSSLSVSQTVHARP